MFYHPATDSEELKCKSVGFAEASVSFTDAFFPDADSGDGAGNIRSCHTQVSFAAGIGERDADRNSVISICRPLQRSRSVLREVEPGYWMEIAVSVPFTKKKKSAPKASETSSAAAAPAAPPPSTAAAASHVIEYEPENVHDSVLDAMLNHSYEMFR